MNTRWDEDEFSSEYEESGRGAHAANLENHDEKPNIVARLHLPEILVALAVAGLLAAVPYAAHAADDDTADSAQVESASTGSAESSARNSSSTASSRPSAKAAGFSVSKKTARVARDIHATTTEEGATGISVSGGGQLVAGECSIATAGQNSPALSVAEDSSLSLVTSKLATTGEDSPLVSSAGRIEMEDITGLAKASPIASLSNGSSLLVSNSTLKSKYAGVLSGGTITGGITNAVTNGNSNAVSGAVVFYGKSESSSTANLTSDAATDSQASASKASASSAKKPTSSLQAQDSTLISSIQEGAMFYATNTQANIVLDNVELHFDKDAANLITAASNTQQGWGTAGENGADVSFTCYDEQIEGNISADAASTLDFYLLEGSIWKGAASIDSNGASTAADISTNTLTVNINATSSWVVTGDSTVTNLNLETGGALVDENGDAVKIMDADGNTLVDGASDVKVSVLGSFTTSVTTTSANELESSSVDRSSYDSEYGTSTAFGSNGTPTSPSIEDESNELAARITEWFHNL